MMRRAAREKWSVRKAELAISLAISASWHFLVLAVLVMAVHPLQLPDRDRAINLELLPPFTPPPPVKIEPPPPPKVQPKPVLRKLIEIKPLAAVPPKLVDVLHPPEPIAPQPVTPQPLETLRPLQPVLRKPVEVERPAPTPAKPLQVQRPSLTITPIPQEPVVARPPQPALPRPVELERPAQAPPRAIVADRPAPPVPAQQAPSEPAPSEPAPSVSAPQTSAAVPVLTNQQVVQAPVEIRPPDRPPAGSLGGGLPAFPGFAPAGGGAQAGGAQAGGGTAGGGGPGSQLQGGRIAGFDSGGGGLRMRRGCLTPETYRLTPEEQAACLNRVGAEASGRRPLEPNIPADKQADYDRYEACHSRAGAAVPGSTAASETTGKILGLGDNARLRDCGPADR